MKNYFKVFRFRKLANGAGNERELPVEKFVFFDDRDDGAVEEAYFKACTLGEEFAKKFSAIRISVYAPVAAYPASIIGDFYFEPPS